MILDELKQPNNQYTSRPSFKIRLWRPTTITIWIKLLPRRQRQNNVVYELHSFSVCIIYHQNSKMHTDKRQRSVGLFRVCNYWYYDSHLKLQLGQFNYVVHNIRFANYNMDAKTFKHSSFNSLTAMKEPGDDLHLLDPRLVLNIGISTLSWICVVFLLNWSLQNSDTL